MPAREWASERGSGGGGWPPKLESRVRVSQLEIPRKGK